MAEILHIIAALVTTTAITSVAAWGYPVGAKTIWDVGFVSMAFVLGMGIKPLREAWAADAQGAAT